MSLLQAGWIAIASWAVLAVAPVLAVQEGEAIFETGCRRCHSEGLPEFPATMDAARTWLMTPGRPHRFALDEPSLEALLEYWQQQEQSH